MDKKLEFSKLQSIHIPMVSKGWTNGNKVMIVMHGLGDSMDSYIDVTKEINVTGLHYILVNAPRPYFFGHSWYDIPPGNPRIGIDESVEILLSCIEELKKEGFESEDIFLLGFSQGGCIAFETYYRYPEKLGGIIGLSPRLYLDKLPNELISTPLFIAHGKNDDAIDFHETLENAKKIKERNNNLVFHEYDYGHTFDIDTIMELREWLNEYL